MPYDIKFIKTVPQLIDLNWGTHVAKSLRFEDYLDILVFLSSRPELVTVGRHPEKVYHLNIMTFF